MRFWVGISRIAVLWIVGLLLKCHGLEPEQEQSNATRILFTTTVDPRYNGPIFGTWIMWFLHSVVAELDTSRYSLHLAIGCMPLKQRDSERLHVNSYGMRLLEGLLQCSYLHDIPGFQKDNNDTHFKFSVTYPNVRRMLMLQGLAETQQWDVIVYADVDAFFIRNPLPELLRLYETGQYAAAFQRDEYNSSERICNGLWAMFDMALPRHIAEHGGYGQAQINDWIRGKMLKAFTSKPTAFRTELSFSSSSVTTKEESHWRFYLLPEPTFYRGPCSALPPSRGPVFVNHCHTTYFRAYEKEVDLRRERLLLPFGNVSNMAYALASTANVTVNATQVLHELANMLNAMNQSIATLREHTGSLLETFHLVATVAQSVNRIASSVNTERVAQPRNLRGSPPHFNPVNTGRSLLTVARDPTLHVTTASERDRQGNVDARRQQLLNEGKQLAQQHTQPLPRPRSRTYHSPTPPRIARTGDRDASPRSPQANINVRPTNQAKAVNTPRSKSSDAKTSESQNYVPQPLVLPPALHRVLEGVFPSNGPFLQHFAVDVDGYFMRDRSAVAKKTHGQAYHIDFVIQEIANPTSAADLRQMIEAMAGWKSMTHRYGLK